MKKILIVLGVVIVLVLITLLFSFTIKPNSGTNNTNTPTSTYVSSFPQEQPIDDVNDPKDTEEDIQENVEIEITTNFLEHESVKPETNVPGYYYLGNTFMPNEDGVAPNYVVVYDEANKFFNITLLKEPLRQSRFEAESYLRSLLEISDVEMCGLEYTLSTPGYVNEEMSGNDFRFSFCEDAMVL